MEPAPLDARSASRRYRLAAALGAVVIVAASWGASRLLFPKPLARAKTAIAARNWAGAEQALTEHLRNVPNDTAARLELGRVLGRTDPQRALETWRQIPAGAPEFVEAARESAELCLARGPVSAAERALLAWREAAPQDPEPLLKLATLYQREKRYHDALSLALRCAELQPDRPETYFLIAELYDDLRRPSEMIAPLEKAIELAPDYEAAHLNLSYAALWAGRSDLARREAQWCLERDPGNVAARCLLAKAARDEGDLEASLKEVQHALSIAPDDLECRILEAELLLFQRQPKLAYQHLRPVYERHRGERRVVGLLARAATASGLAAEGRRLQQESLRLADDAP